MDWARSWMDEKIRGKKVERREGKGGNKKGVEISLNWTSARKSE